MSTRSIIGTTDGTTFEGIFCYFDGYPSHMVRALATIITRDGDAALPVLTGQEKRARGGETANWESLDPEMPSPDTELPYPNRGDYLKNVPVEDQDAGLSALYVHLDTGDPAERRDQVIEGYGTVMTRNPVRFSGTITDRDVNLGWCEWAYLFTEDLTVVVYEVLTTGLSEVGRFTRDDLKAITEGDEEACERISHAECAEDYSRCSHVAWVHAPDAPEESKHLGMREWLGLEPVSLDQAVAAVVGGTRYELTGSSSVRSGVLSLYLRGGDALPVAKTDKRGRATKTLPGIELVLPPTKPELAKAGV